MDPVDLGYANLSNLRYIEDLYSKYLQDPSLVDLSFRRFFEGMEFANSLNHFSETQPSPEDCLDVRSLNLIEAYKHFGHLNCFCNPIHEENKDQLPEELHIENFGFSKEDLKKLVPTFNFLPQDLIELELLIDALNKTYCTTLGLEAYHCSKPIQEYIYSRIQPILEFPFAPDEKVSFYKSLCKAEMFETFLQMKYQGQKRFSLEGGESLIPILNELYKTLAETGGKSSVLGMAHRGRLNVLANIFNKPYEEIFYEFEPGYIPSSFAGSGDVKYHKGQRSKLEVEGGLEMDLILADNPSHLEAVNTVVLGMTKAKQVYESEGDERQVAPILIHGDASIAGQGVVYEALQTMQLDGYEVGGTIHIVINNQVGFTAEAKESRSTRYPTDIAKTFGCPVFHVNGDDPEACIFAARVAAEVRQIFGIDVFIELLCYRKYGHNEGDEPAFTQPTLYEKIKQKPSVVRLYEEKLLQSKELSKESAEAIQTQFKSKLDEALQKTQERVKANTQSFSKSDLNQNIPLSKIFFDVETKIDKNTLKTLAESFCKIPDKLNVHSKIQRLFNERLSAILEEKAIEWGLAEYLAYATLLVENHSVRISGQDSKRGTFSHRHAALVDQSTNERYFPLANLGKDQALFTAYNSCLSEYGILGFEFGYASIASKGVTIWEAQFGDFANGAQIMIDQFLSASEQKWGLKSPLILFLPHGYEGMGPEHSSARIERYLQLASCFNMEIVLPSNTAQMFHLLRKHVLSNAMKPLVVFTPKMTLRFPPSLSPLSDFFEGKFEEILEDPKQNYEASRVLLCSGKIYYDLVTEREKRALNDIDIIRIEQLYPFHREKLQEILHKYSHLKECFYVQEEHSNMGAYSYLAPYLREILPDKLKLCYVGRSRSASTAAGSGVLHNLEKQSLLDQAFGKVES